MPRAVLVQHHPRQRPPLPPPPMRALARRLGHHARPLKMQLRPGVAPAKAVILDQMLVEVLDREALITLAVERLHLLGPVDRNPLARRLAEPPVDKARLAVLLIAARPSPECPLAHPEQFGRLSLIELRRFPAVPEGSKTPPCAHPEGLPSSASNPSSKGQTYRTDRALPKPDISCASDSASAGPNP